MPIRLSLAALSLLVLSGIAFWPAYLSQIQAAGRVTHGHAALGAAWLLLLVTQPILIRLGLRGAHRVIGRLGVLVGAAFVGSGVLIAHQSVARMGAEQFAREGHLVYLPLSMAAVFAVALLMAVVWRSAPAVHARFMAATALPLLDPLFARILYFYGPPLPADYLYQVPAFLTVMLTLVGLHRSLPVSAAGRRAFLWFACGVTAAVLGFFAIAPTAPWRWFAMWFRSLPIT